MPTYIQYTYIVALVQISKRVYVRNILCDLWNLLVERPRRVLRLLQHRHTPSSNRVGLTYECMYVCIYVYYLCTVSGMNGQCILQPSGRMTVAKAVAGIPHLLFPRNRLQYVVHAAKSCLETFSNICINQLLLLLTVLNSLHTYIDITYIQYKHTYIHTYLFWWRYLPVEPATRQWSDMKSATEKESPQKTSPFALHRYIFIHTYIRTYINNNY